MKLEIVERSSGYWIVGDWGVEWYEPFIHLEDAVTKLQNLEIKPKKQEQLPSI